MKTLFLFFLFSSSFAAEPRMSELQASPGWAASLYATVPNARSLTLGGDGIVYVGTRDNDKVYALLPDKTGSRAKEVKVVAKGLEDPNGVAYKNGDLYIAEVSRILMVRQVEKNLAKPVKPEPWGPSFPTESHHGWKFISFGPDGWLYVPVGAPCNVCEKDPQIYAALHRVSPDGKKRELVAQGIRNTVGFDWDPRTKRLWFTENGRDLMGDDVPGDELNEVPADQTVHFGFPHCHAGEILDPEFGKGKSCKDYAAPKLLFPAHVAALGMRFLKHQKNEVRNGTILVAERGSWNRSSKVGYQVEEVVTLGNGKELRRAPFLTGFLKGENAWGRPVDVLELADGSVLVSDDTADAVYRIRRTGK